ncbi:helix-turn-helix domain-containing protein [Noviherbaspirillum sp.]|jgi:DNA-binding transcriptional regulator YiaG|uniref:helix-turn-helix domain-containing protein n=1 Tax=Noviherbaspirillum sp. TaxID=1926288 RepID=UPI0025F524C8|nr:helix-turn-helix domain-containing protein [Noviherbaspirillum sp.]
MREAAGLTQGQAAALIYRTARNWQQWEGGERRMDPALWELFRLKSTPNSVRN